jgi:hypothetical protein
MMTKSQKRERAHVWEHSIQQLKLEKQQQHAWIALRGLRGVANPTDRRYLQLRQLREIRAIEAQLRLARMAEKVGAYWLERAS